MNERAGSRPSSSSPASSDRPLSRRWADLLPRALSGIVMVALALGTALAGGLVFSLFWLAASAAILWEWQHLIGREGAGRRFAVGTLALAVGVALLSRGAAGWALAMLAAGLLGTLAAGPARFRLAAGFGLLYAAALLASVSLLRASHPGGLASILWLFAVVWGTDIMAYFGGRLLGGPKLWRRLSPSKTWSGFLIGVGCGALAGLAVAPMPSIPLVALGVTAGALAQAGDLFESSLKRRYGVKDASRMIPGHGGVMDRLDGFIAAAVFAACLGVARFGIDAAGAGLFNW